MLAADTKNEELYHPETPYPPYPYPGGDTDNSIPFKTLEGN